MAPQGLRSVIFTVLDNYGGRLFASSTLPTGYRVKSRVAANLAGTRAAVVQKRVEAKDNINVAAVLSEGGIDLPLALASARAIHGAQFNPQNSLKALVFFEEGNLKRLPQAVKKQLADAVRKFDLAKLPHLTCKRLEQGRKRENRYP